MGASKLCFLIAASGALALPVTPRAQAQCRLCDTPTTARANTDGTSEVRLEIETSLDFDRLILSATSGGSAVIRPDGSVSAEGAVASVSARAMVGTVSIHGQPGRAVRIELPQRIELYSLGGGRITLDSVASDLAALPRLDSAGNLAFRFGGRLRIEGDAEGDYRGDLPITVEYL